MDRLQTSVLIACSAAPALLTFPRGKPDALGNNDLRALLPWPFFRSWWWGWSMVAGVVMGSMFVNDFLEIKSFIVLSYAVDFESESFV